MTPNRIFAIIPARGGSKRIPGKNKKDFCGKPLVMWTIEEAIKTFMFQNIILSSDDPDIINIGAMYDKIDLHHRPEHTSGDKTSAFEVVKDIIRTYDLKDDNLIVYLQPTSPLRTSKDIIDAFFMYVNSKIPKTSLISGVLFSLARYSFIIDNFNVMDPLDGSMWFENRTHNLPKTYIPNGAIYIITVRNILKYKSFYTLRTLVYVMPDITSVDIDDMVDWEYAEYLMRKKRLYNDQEYQE